MKPVGIISGTIPLHEEDIFKDLEKTVVENEFGSALVLLSGMVAFIPRHGMDAKSSIPPHMINHHANLKALQDMGVKEIIGINSTGSLKRALEPGTIIIPDDYISTSGTPTIFHNSAGRNKNDVPIRRYYWNDHGKRGDNRGGIRAFIRRNLFCR
ncbi:MAG: hypothetical protein JRC66_10710 [Deltaproteobacteria bacterium]|nr:hypothetical protein [Deltaproteobacteria bacterium]